MFRSGDRVKETTTTTGTGDIALLGAVAQFQAFSAVCANADMAMYAIVGQSGTEWEVGYGQWQTGNTLVRSLVLGSSNAGALVAFSAGTKDVFNTWPGFNGIFPPATHVINDNALIAADAGTYIPRYLEIAAGKTLEIGAGGDLEIG